MSNNTQEMYIKHFRHFSERLSLRYNILITLQQYIEMCNLQIDIVKVKIEEKNKKSLVGYVFYNETKIKVIKSCFIEGKPLLTALPVVVKFKHNKTK